MNSLHMKSILDTAGPLLISLPFDLSADFKLLSWTSYIMSKGMKCQIYFCARGGAGAWVEKADDADDKDRR